MKKTAAQTRSEVTLTGELVHAGVRKVAGERVLLRTDQIERLRALGLVADERSGAEDSRASQKEDT